VFVLDEMELVVLLYLAEGDKIEPAPNRELRRLYTSSLALSSRRRKHRSSTE
jgi:hypothetical protein